MKITVKIISSAEEFNQIQNEQLFSFLSTPHNVRFILDKLKISQNKLLLTQVLAK